MRVLYKWFLIKWFKTFLEMWMKYNLSEQAMYRLKIIDFYLNKSWKNITKTSNHFCIHRNTISRWLHSFDKLNLHSLEPKIRKPLDTFKRKRIDSNIEFKITELKRRYPYYWKEKLKAILQRNFNVSISSSTIWRIIKKYKLTYIWRKYESACKFKKTVKKRKTNKSRLKDFLDPKKILKVWQVIQIDTVRILYNWENVYIINAIDVYSKLAVSYAYKSPSSTNAKDFLENKVLKFFWVNSNIKLRFIQTDNWSEFHKFFDRACTDLKIKHVWNYPKSPKMNSNIEKFNWTIQIECLEKFDAIRDLKLVNEKIKRYLIEYNTFRPHQALNYLTPIDIYIRYQLEQINSSIEKEKMHHMLWTSAVLVCHSNK
jgi:transposase InsO family protein